MGQVNRLPNSFAGSLAVIVIACGGHSTSSPPSTSHGGHASGGGTAGTSSTDSASGGSGGSAGSENSASGAGSSSSAGGSSAAGSPSSRGGAESTGSAGEAGAAEATGGANNAGASGAAPSACGIVRRIALPEVLATGTDNAGASNVATDFARRTPGGFGFGPWVERSETSRVRLHWLRVAPDEAQTQYGAEFLPNETYLDFLNIGAPTHVVQIGASWVSTYTTAWIDHAGTALTAGSTLFDSDYQPDPRSGYRGATASLDEQRGLFMAAGLNGGAPRLTLFAADGTRLGDVLPIPNSGSCYTLTPTEHAGAFSWVDQAFHWVEFGASGSVALDVQIALDKPPAGRPACPMLALTDAGFAFISYDPNTTWELHRVARDGTSSVESWHELIGTPVALAIRGDTALAVTRLADGYYIFKHAHGQDEVFPIESYGKQIPSEAGSLFLYVSRSLPAAREIVEVRCAD